MDTRQVEMILRPHSVYKQDSADWLMQRELSALELLAAQDLSGRAVEYAHSYRTPVDYRIIVEYIREPVFDLRTHIPSVAVQRIPACVLGQGVLGRCYTGTAIVQIRDDIHDYPAGRTQCYPGQRAEYAELLYENVFAHEAKHHDSPHLSESQVYFWTDQLLYRAMK
jgi:hypothetical protein